MGQLLLFTSPPASGKTFWIRAFAEELEGELLVISPLRALADECRSQWKGKISVMTPEEWLGKRTYPKIVIFDEIHLLSYWGNTFRPLLWHVFIELSAGAELVIGLTATFSEKLRSDLRQVGAGFTEILWLDRGNQILKYHPFRYSLFPKFLIRRIIFHLPGEGTSLIFCQFREEVSLWEEELWKAGFRVWGCRGGEAAAFSMRVRDEAPPDFIVATTVLSHGVNLPVIRRVFFLYPVGNIDFWIQMTARGGRRGESFEVFALDRPHGLRWSGTRNFLSGVSFWFRTITSVTWDQFAQCFLKE